MRARSIAFLACLLLSAGGVGASAGPLEPDRAAAVGGWSGPDAVQGIILQSIIESDGCLKFGQDVIVIADHLDNTKPQVASVYRKKPGRYAVVGVRWAEPWLDQYDMAGVSRPKGDAWVVDLAPGTVTDLGVWSITAPYAHRYLPSNPSVGKGSPGASELVARLAPLHLARWTQARVIDADSVCPRTAVAG